MDGFLVECADLTHAENAVRALAQEFADSASLKYAIAVTEVGHAELAEALAEFHHQSWRVSGELCVTAVEAADRLHDTAAAYTSLDQSVVTMGGGEPDTR